MSDTKFGIVIIISLLQFTGFLCGALDVNYYSDGKCHYKNIAQITNVGYIVACELFKHRSWIKEFKK
jgi:hypothetical protein